MRFIDENGLRYFWKKINERMNDLVTKGLHSCESCGAPYIGEPNCQYCGRGFFVDFKMYKEHQLQAENK